MKHPPANRLLRASRTGLLAVASILTAGFGWARGPQNEEPLVFSLRLEQARPSGEAETERLASELARLPGALEAYFAIASAGGIVDPEGRVRPLGADPTRLLERTALRFDSSAVVLYVRDTQALPRDVPWRRVALELIGLHGSSAHLSLLAGLCVEPPGAPPALGLVEPFREALTGLLRRVGASPHELRWLSDEFDPLRESIVRAVGRCGDPEGLLWLTEQIEHPLVGVSALQEIGRLASSARGQQAAAMAKHLHPYLQSADPARRRHAIRALGALGQGASLPRLTGFLAPDVPAGERRMAHTALRTISGVNLPCEATAWRDWFEREKRWFQEFAEPTLARLSSPDDAVVVAATQELSGHPLHRDRFAERLAPLLGTHDSSTVRAQVCLGLARLRSARGLVELTAALNDEAPDVRTRAHRALCTITGLSLGNDPLLWQDVCRPPAPGP